MPQQFHQERQKTNRPAVLFDFSKTFTSILRILRRHFTINQFCSAFSRSDHRSKQKR